jgi:anti-sigma-K factor RskA
MDHDSTQTTLDTLATHVSRRRDDCNARRTTARLTRRMGSSLASMAVLLLLVVGRVAAQDAEKPIVCNGEEVPAAIAAVIDLLNSIQLWGMAIGLAAAAVAIVYAGILLTVAGGDPQKVERAKTVIMYAAFGVVIILLSGALVELVEWKICQSL